MDHRFNHHPLVHEQEDSPTTPENAAESPLSGDDTTKTDTPSPRKRSVKKRVVSIPIGGLDGSRGKGEAYSPSDSWSWRKYGQKPIKGSPYPRGYYRCSSSKGCPARKQVERSHLDPTVLLITYSYDHNHPALPLTKHHHHHTTTSSSSSTTTIPAKLPPEEFAAFANQPDLEPDNHFANFPGELGWFSDVGSTILESPVFVEPTCSDADVAIALPIGEEDEPLFGDLGELPECSVVFRRRVETPFSGSTG